MSFFKQAMADDMSNAFLNADEFAETILFIKRDPAVPARSIVAHVVRGDIRGKKETDHGVELTMTVVVKNHATQGILSTEIEPGNGDALIVPWEEGKTLDATDQTQKQMITAIPEQDPAALTFRFGPR